MIEESPPLWGGKENLASEKNGTLSKTGSLSKSLRFAVCALLISVSTLHTSSAVPGGGAIWGPWQRRSLESSAPSAGRSAFGTYYAVHRMPHAHGLCCRRRAWTGAPKSGRPADIRPGRKRSGHQARRAGAHFRQKGKAACRGCTTAISRGEAPKRLRSLHRCS